MIPGSDQAVQALRDLVLCGRFARGARLGEAQVAQVLGVSRTPARLAMAELQREGLLTRQPRRGYRVCSFTIDQVADAIEVRGEIEAMAARQLAETGLSDGQLAQLEKILARSDLMLSRLARSVEDRIGWTEANLAFHQALIDLTGNIALQAVYERVIRIPLVSPKAIVFNRSAADFGLAQVRTADQDHRRVLEAISARKGQRAAEIMRDHSLRSGQNKRRNLTLMAEDEVLVSAPGLALVCSAGPDHRGSRALSWQPQTS